MISGSGWEFFSGHSTISPFSPHSWIIRKKNYEVKFKRSKFSIFLIEKSYKSFFKLFLRKEFFIHFFSHFAKPEAELTLLD